MAQATARSMGLLAEALALVSATTVSGDGDQDLKSRAEHLQAGVEGVTTSPSRLFTLYLPTWLGGSDDFQKEADAIAAEYKVRHGIDPLEVLLPKPSGDVATAMQIGSGQIASGTDVIAEETSSAVTKTADAIADAGTSLTRWAKWIGLALILLIIAFAVLEGKSLAKAVKA
jgi:hypothetical protein